MKKIILIFCILCNFIYSSNFNKNKKLIFFKTKKNWYLLSLIIPASASIIFRKHIKNYWNNINISFLFKDKKKTNTYILSESEIKKIKEEVDEFKDALDSNNLKFDDIYKKKLETLLGWNLNEYESFEKQKKLILYCELINNIINYFDFFNEDNFSQKDIKKHIEYLSNKKKENKSLFFIFYTRIYYCIFLKQKTSEFNFFKYNMILNKEMQEFLFFIGLYKYKKYLEKSEKLDIYSAINNIRNASDAEGDPFFAFLKLLNGSNENFPFSLDKKDTHPSFFMFLNNDLDNKQLEYCLDPNNIDYVKKAILFRSKIWSSPTRITDEMKEVKKFENDSEAAFLFNLDQFPVIDFWKLADKKKVDPFLLLMHGDPEKIPALGISNIFKESNNTEIYKKQKKILDWNDDTFLFENYSIKYKKGILSLTSNDIIKRFFKKLKSEQFVNFKIDDCSKEFFDILKDEIKKEILKNSGLKDSLNYKEAIIEFNKKNE